ncbi:MAG: glutamate-1-semialdehyde 2,1-aminomutase, partial [Planctomycetes bacterium]|nr:glutamate-1-semialdehyde 2,1-aminomutase [Planctomycetota bacterium]
MTSAGLYRRAERVIPGGVNSPVRAFRSVGGEPVFIASGEGSRVRDVEGRESIDYVGSWGPLILGHRHPAVIAAIEEALGRGLSFGAPTAAEVDLAERVSRLVPSIEMVRLVNSGTEATLSAARLARGATGRDRIIKFAGCYHGHGDSFLIQAGSGALTFGVPSSPGVPRALAELTLVARYNDADGVRALAERHRGQIAAIFVEPVAGNMGCVPPNEGFLEALREIADAEGILLVFDEVMTGFRLAPGGAQEIYGVRPDVTTLGKILGGGLPIGAYGGARILMEKIAPAGPIYQAGTLSGNPIATAAGLATLGALAPEVYERLERLSRALAEGLEAAARKAGVAATVNRAGSMLTLFFAPGPVTDLESAMASDAKRFAAFFRAMLRR